jgi:RNA polymerase sigma factor (sigma-70 family)
MGHEISSHQLDRCWRLARKMASRWCRADSDAEDAAQEVLLRLIRQREKPANEVAWLYVVTRRVCNRMRLGAEHRSHAEQWYAHMQWPMAASNDLAIEIGGILHELPPRDRRILELVIDGATAREIALSLGCKTRDVGQLVTRARRKARRLSNRSR